MLECGERIHRGYHSQAQTLTMVHLCQQAQDPQAIATTAALLAPRMSESKSASPDKKNIGPSQSEINGLRSTLPWATANRKVAANARNKS